MEAAGRNPATVTCRHHYRMAFLCIPLSFPDSASLHPGYVRFVSTVGLRKEIDDLLQQPRAPHRWQALPNAPAIWLVNQARVANHQDTAIGLVADQTSGALLQGDDRFRQLILHERVTSLRVEPVDAGGQDRVVGRRER